MNLFFQKIYITIKDEVLSSIGIIPSYISIPIKTDTKLKTYPYNTINANLNSVIDWSQFQNARYFPDGSFPLSLKDNRANELLKNLVCAEKQKSFSIDIKRISGLLASKSELSESKDLCEFAQKNTKEYIKELSEENFYKLLKHREIRIIHGNNTTDHFVKYSWDDRYFLSNAGGSHHFAAAHYIAQKLGINHKLKGTLYKYELNGDSVRELFELYNSVAINDTLSFNFIESFRKFDCPFFLCSAPNQLNTAKILLFPKKNKRATNIFSLFMENGYWNIIKHLQEKL